MFWNRVFVDDFWWAGRAKRLNVFDRILGRSERQAGRARATKLPATCLVFVCAAICNRLNQVRGVRRTPHRVALYGIASDDTCIQCCATCMRAVRMKPVPISIQDTPAAVPELTLEQRVRRLVCHSIRLET